MQYWGDFDWSLKTRDTEFFSTLDTHEIAPPDSARRTPVGDGIGLTNCVLPDGDTDLPALGRSSTCVCGSEISNAGLARLLHSR